MANKYLDGMAVAIVVFFGIMFFGMSMSVFKNLDANCPSSSLRDGWAVIQALGALMITAGIYYFYCVVFNNCYKNSDSIRTSEVYFGIFGLFFGIMAGICGSMLKNYKDLQDSNKQNCDDNSGTTKRLTTTVLVLCVIGFLGCSGMIARMFIRKENSDVISESPSSIELN
jgi:uncharacterized membrane protein HdeD (DUF308 family)